MIKYLFILVISSLYSTVYAQSNHPVNYNFGMEELPADSTWFEIKGYSLTADTKIKHGGRMSLLMQQTNSVDAAPFTSYLFYRADKFLGKEIEVRAWMKFENVKNYVSLTVMVNDEKGRLLQRENLDKKQLRGSKDWALYSVKMRLPQDGQYLSFGGMLFGPGKLWTDDIEVLIDGKDITQAPVNPKFNPNPINYGDNSVASGTVKLKDASLYYETYGSGQPLLLIHGDNQSIEAFSKQIPELSRHYKVIAVDSRGQGKSTDLTTAPLTYEKFADDMKQLLDSLRIKKTDVLGWSDGGITGLLMAMNYPSYINKLAITGSNLESTSQAIDSKVLKAVSADLEVLKKDTTARGVMKTRLFTMMLNEPHISSESLKSIKAPVLVMAGEHDLVLEKHTKLIAESIPNSKLYIFKGASHYVPVEKIDEFNEIVNSFFKAP